MQDARAHSLKTTTRPLCSGKAISETLDVVWCWCLIQVKYSKTRWQEIAREEIFIRCVSGRRRKKRERSRQVGRV